MLTGAEEGPKVAVRVALGRIAKTRSKTSLVHSALVSAS